MDSEQILQQMAFLASAFVEKCPARLSDARAHLERMVAGQPGAAAGFVSVMHGLKGAGATFGFPALSDFAGRAEALAKRSAAGTAITPDTLTALKHCLDTMRTMLPTMKRAAVAWPAAANGAVANPAGQDRRPLLYICDSDPSQAEKLAGQLQLFGFELCLFASTAALCTAARARCPDLAVIDIVQQGSGDGGSDGGYVGGSDGDRGSDGAALAALRADGIRFPLVFTSARSDFDTRLTAVQASGEAFFVKPLNVLELAGTAATLVGKTAHKPLTVLVVDDDPLLTEHHCLVLEGGGLLAVSTQDPHRVLDMLAEYRPDLVLTDMYMPGCNGQQLAKLIRQIPEYMSLPIIFLSAEMDGELQKQALGTGAEGFLSKSISPADLVSSVSMIAARMRAIRALMVQDGMTKLYNHSALINLLVNAIATAHRNQSRLCFAMVDLDRFKSINDTHGHPVGDQVIMGLARVLQQRLRATDLVGRYGGEEFAVILPDVDIEKAREIMDDMRQDFGRVLFGAIEDGFCCTFSCGLVSLDDFPPGTQMEAFRLAADGALYEAKRGGRNRVVVGGPARK